MIEVSFERNSLPFCVIFCFSLCPFCVEGIKQGTFRQEKDILNTNIRCRHATAENILHSCVFIFFAHGEWSAGRKAVIAKTGVIYKYKASVRAGIRPGYGRPAIVGIYTPV